MLPDPPMCQSDSISGTGKWHLPLKVWIEGDLNSDVDFHWQMLRWLQPDSANPSATGHTRHISTQEEWQRFLS